MNSYSHATDLRRAISLLESGRIAEAEAIAQLALKQDRKNALVHALLGKIADTKGQLDAAAKHYEKSIRLDSKQMMTHVALGQLRTNQGRYKEAIAGIERALRLHPDNPNAIAALADAHDKGGEPERALVLLHPFIQSDSETHPMAVVFATVKMNMGDHEAGIQMAHKHLESQELGANARQLLGFTLGRSLEAIGHYDESFEAYQHANQALPSDFNPDSFSKSIDDLITVFSKSRFSTLSRSRQTTELPVFITGMPRSGTTLVERIINTHPEARGAGEIIFLQRLISDMPLTIQSDQPYPQCVLDMDENDADRMAKGYLNDLRLFARGVQRVTDKNLLNWRHLGLISCLFPKARVIHCLRNPLDTCFSCFTSSL
ncbi:MAG: sulfotransferase, partial [Planctomycetes bacterium]|nr:sulfotransferase [Planctomycetota bacterium]